MAIGERIHFFRLRRGLTQKYETGSRKPKADLTAALA